MSSVTPLVEKSCGSCTMCCKVYPVPVLNKPAGKWCNHCKPGQGCGIWQDRPEFCRDFFCRYMVDPNLGPAWKPDNCKFVMNYQPNGTFAVSVDPGHRMAWKREPYYSGLKRISGQLLEQGIAMFVEDSVNKIIVTPNEDVLAGGANDVPNYEILKDVRAGVTSYRVIIKS